MLENRWVCVPRSDEVQASHFSSFLWESILKNVLNTIKSVTFMTRKYGMTIKLAERGNERVLKVSLTERQETVKFKEFTEPMTLVW